MEGLNKGLRMYLKMCSDCSQPFWDGASLARHLKASGHKTPCPKCEAELSEVEISRHYTMCVDEIWCATCKEKTDSSSRNIIMASCALSTAVGFSSATRHSAEEIGRNITAGGKTISSSKFLSKYRL